MSLSFSSLCSFCPADHLHGSSSRPGQAIRSGRLMDHRMCQSGRFTRLVSQSSSNSSKSLSPSDWCKPVSQLASEMCATPSGSFSWPTASMLLSRGCCAIIGNNELLLLLLLMLMLLLLLLLDAAYLSLSVRPSERQTSAVSVCSLSR